jgi:hypothetical protein
MRDLDMRRCKPATLRRQRYGQATAVYGGVAERIIVHRGTCVEAQTGESRGVGVWEEILKNLEGKDCGSGLCLDPRLIRQ